MSRPLITLTTDYGAGDHLVGVMKGVILGINPEAEIIDINHQVKAYDILDGALAIGNAYHFFPPRTIHVVVVDPGVGTQRRPILVSADQYYFVAPDNGVLSCVYDRAGSLTVWHITAEHYFLRPVSKTFHGRDIFAPVAAWLSKSWQSASFGEEVQDFVRFTLPKPRKGGDTARGVVLRVDNFGNLITNLTAEDLPQLSEPDAKFALRVGNSEITRLAQTFSQGAPGEAIALFGSSGFLEIAVNRGNAARVLSVQRGAEVSVQLG